MDIKPDKVREGDILLGHGLLMAPASLLEKNHPPLDEGRLLDFSTFINALTLHDRLITLPAEIPADLRNSRLFQYLEKNRILCHLDIDYDSFPLKRRKEMEQDLIGREFSQDEANLVLGNTKQLFYFEYFLDDHVGQNADQRRKDFVMEIINMKRQDWIKKVPTNSVLKSDTPLSRHLLRTAIYWEIADMLKIPFMLDFARIPIIAGYMARVTQSLRELIDKRVYDLSKPERDDALGLSTTTILPIPNAFLNFLDRYYDSSDLEQSLDSLRNDFSAGRKVIVEWESKVTRADISRDELFKIMNEINSKLSSLAKTDWNSIVVSHVPGIARSIVDGTAGISSAEPLVKDLISFIWRWKNRRSISYFNDGKKEAGKIANDPQLLTNALGDTLTGTQISRYQMLCNSLSDLTKPI